MEIILNLETVKRNLGLINIENEGEVEFGKSKRKNNEKKSEIYAKVEYGLWASMVEHLWSSTVSDTFLQYPFDMKMNW